MRGAVALIICVASASVAAADPVVFSNGSRAGFTARCDSGPDVCAGTGFWTIYDDFSFPSRTTVTGFSFSDQLVSGSLNDYLHTEWSIWASDPLGGGTPLASGTTVAHISADRRSSVFTATGLNVPLLARQTYWLGTFDLFSEPTIIGRDSATGMNRPGYKQSDGGLNNFELEGDTFFTISGNAATPSPTPEPATVVLLVSGIAGLLVQQRSRCLGRCQR